MSKRFTKNEDSVIFDTETNLEWFVLPGNNFTWEQAEKKFEVTWII